MSPKELTAFRVDPDVMKALRAVKARTGLPIAVQVDFALRAWLRSKGAMKMDRKRAATHKGS